LTDGDSHDPFFGRSVLLPNWLWSAKQLHDCTVL
jgi:hypothetical protein